MFKTITGYWDEQMQENKSLIHMRQNENRTNFPNMGEDTKFLLRDVYINALREIGDTIKNHPGGLFTQIIQKTCKKSFEEVKKIINDYVDRHNLIFPEEDVNNICIKQRGNFGEILFEILAVNGLLAMYFKPGENNVEIVDPDNEHKFDQKCVSQNDDLPFYVQIKNYSSKIIKEKALEFFKDCRYTRLEGEQEFYDGRDEDLLKFIKNPHVALFSFSECDEWIKKTFEKQVLWIGPNEINFIPNISNVYGPYYKAADEIAALK